jgi:hypothetical protein
MRTNLINPAVLRYRTIVDLSVDREGVRERDIGTRGRPRRISNDRVLGLTSPGIPVFVKLVDRLYLLRARGDGK